jgi:hypothetical protein
MGAWSGLGYNAYNFYKFNQIFEKAREEYAVEHNIKKPHPNATQLILNYTGETIEAKKLLDEKCRHMIYGLGGAVLGIGLWGWFVTKKGI